MTSNPITSQVRFHENVRVRKIKATVKKRPLREDNLDDDFIFDDDDSGSGNSGSDDEHKFDGQDETEDSDEDPQQDSKVGPGGQSPEVTTIQRLKHDFFSEEVEEQYDGNTLIFK